MVPATKIERQKVLPRLQQILTARVAIAELPIELTNIKISTFNTRWIWSFCFCFFFFFNIFFFVIENGIVTLSVDGEFEVKLGIKSDSFFAPWHVHKTKLFLRDPEEPGMKQYIEKKIPL